jgi:hypothetical protein
MYRFSAVSALEQVLVIHRKEYMTISDSSHVSCTPSRAIGLITSGVLLLGSLAGCTGAQVSTVVKDIGVYAQQAEPILLAIIPVITALSSSSQNAGTGSSLNSFASVAKADLDALTVLCNDYTATPSSSNFNQIESIVDKLVGESDASLLQVMAIKDPSTRQEVQVGIASFDALIHTIDGFVQTTQSASAVAAKAQTRVHKLQEVATFWSGRDKASVASAFSTSYDALAKFEAKAGL